MPVILDPASYSKWLGEEPTDPPHLMMMLKPYPAEAMEAYPVSTRVGNVKNTEAEVFEPLAAS
jgi:putative SOS response-associated peptidase YedK